MISTQLLTHNCLDHLVMRSGTSVEPHGETHYDEWDECSVCNTRYTEDEVRRMWDAEGNKQAAIDMQHRRNALEFLAEAARALDQARSELRDIGLEKEVPYADSIVDFTAVFPGTTTSDKRLSCGLALNVEDLVEAVAALYQEIRG